MRLRSRGCYVSGVTFSSQLDPVVTNAGPKVSVGTRLLFGSTQLKLNVRPVIGNVSEPLV
jgi:hypothetical protein